MSKRAILGCGAAAFLLASCGGEAPGAPKAVPFESRDWGIQLEYPGDWEAVAGEGVEPLILRANAPGKKDTIGAGFSVVGAWSAAPLDVVASSFERKAAAAGDVATSAVDVDGRPGRAFEYRERRGSEYARVRTLVVAGTERYYIITFAAYVGQYETVRPCFEAIEKSVRVR
ncbi:MAG TPA: hypothetical protein VMW93_10125 [bacterium]|nr:hypothetical protein [bacterium]